MQTDYVNTQPQIARLIHQGARDGLMGRDPNWSVWLPTEESAAYFLAWQLGESYRKTVYGEVGT